MNSLRTGPAERLLTWLQPLGIDADAVDDTLALLHPGWGLRRMKAQLVERRPETPGAVTLVLRCPARMQTPLPGQHVQIGVRINGVIHRRAYSLRVVPDRPGCVAITVQRQPGGRVSSWLHGHAKVGDLFDLGQAAGDFVMPSPPPAEVLFVAGGSGITPFMAMLEHLRRTQAPTRVTLVYFARSRSDRIFGRLLDDLARTWPALNLVAIDSHAHVDTDPGAAKLVPTPILTADLLNRCLPGWSRLIAWCCGPAPLMDAAREIWAAQRVSHRLKLEAFAPRVNRPAGQAGQTTHRVSLTREGRPQQFDAPGALSVLEAAERAGVHPRHGCRQGICHECTCRLTSGTVLDLRTGLRREGHGELVQICVSAPLSDLSLDSVN